MKCLVAGGAGFIGSNLIEACLKKGFDVINVDNLATGSDEMADPIRVMDLPGSYAFINMDINNTKKLTEVMKGCEVVFLLAALPRVSYSIDFPIEASHANITGTLSVLEASRQAKVKRVIFACSSSIFGGTANFPTMEYTKPAPLSPYALHKLTGYEYCKMYSKLHGLETLSLIYYNVFGPYQRTGKNSAYATCIPAFFSAAVGDKKCRVDGDGNQSRDFTYIDNVVNANILAAESKKKFAGEKVNIANGVGHSVNDVLGAAEECMGVKLEKVNAPARLGDPQKSLADIELAKIMLGYESKVDFSEGMKRTALWWKNGCPTRKS